MKTVNRYRLWQRDFHDYVTEAFSMLKDMRRRRDRRAFNKIIESRLAGIQRYVARRISMAEANGALPKGQYQASDFINQLYVISYDHFDEVIDHENLYEWLFVKVDDLLEDAMIEKEFDDVFVENIERYTAPEWDALEERYSIDAGGDLVMEEELDDPMIHTPNDYIQNEAFVEELEQSIINQLQKNIDGKDIDKHVDTALAIMPSNASTAFDLTINQGFNLEEVSNIKKMPVTKVSELFRIAKTNIVRSLVDRFL